MNWSVTTVTAILYTVLAALAVCWVVGRRKNKPQRPTVTPSQPQEIFVDATTNEFTLIGSDWQWLEDQLRLYMCSKCDQPENVRLRCYKHIPTGKHFASLLHECSGKKTVQTDEIVPVSGGLV